ncbi:MAG: 4Fe-4S dicluster domain-containing protein [Syntrophales bacterium]|jgi:Fe-S-cluster-containing dehydrogenase component|nr:4Fe-4S dicluster domain-containing protein [Syntrophales bacterium]MDY0043190.1 4Fe-4S dicluster domain-containing protein [Syntrophales bacterium]
MKDNQGSFSRRSFLKVTGGLALMAGIHIPKPVQARSTGMLATLIDLSLCDGCPDLDIPACVKACRAKNMAGIPDPVDPMPALLPRGVREDWSKKKDVTDRLTPYNWIFLQKAEVEKDGDTKTLFIPRRCMHCDNPACATICPFSANHKHTTGAVIIDKDLCFGGAKCRTVCPWNIPQRQSGVGIYLDILPELAGNGVMFKCDLCQDRILNGETPACIEACPRGAMRIGRRNEMYEEAEARAKEINGFVYGKNENGGTSTFYISPVSFETIDAAIHANPGKPHLKPVKRALAKTDGTGKSVLLSPAIGLVAGIAAAAGTLMKKRIVRVEEERKNGRS